MIIVKSFSFACLLLMLLSAGCSDVDSVGPDFSPAALGLTISATSLAFPTTMVGQASVSQTVTLTNVSNANLSRLRIELSDPTDYSMVSTCGAALATNSTCTISATFRPAAADSYSATISVSDSASPKAWSIGLSGWGTTVSITHTLYVFPETDGSITPLYTLVNGAKKSIDMEMWALMDTTFSGDLVAACNRGVKVRVILDQNEEMSDNMPAFNQLNAVPNCSAVWANVAFASLHQKSFIVDGMQAAITSLNLQAVDYTYTRDYALVENDPEDIAAIQATFDADYAAGTTSSGVIGASDFGYQPGLGEVGSVPGGDLIWSPTNAQADMLAMINNAKATLLIEAEEMDAANLVEALVAACQRGVQVHITMTDDTADYGTEFAELQAGGCGLYLYPDLGEYTSSTFYIHAKATIADYGLPTQSVYMGSINYDTPSMTENRELGLFITDPASIQLLYNTMATDYAGNGTTY